MEPPSGCAVSLHFLRYEDLNIEHIYLDGAPVARLNTVMRKMMDYAYALADERRIPVILDTDDRDKAARYEHLGMKLDRVRSCGERFHMYDLIRFDDALLGGAMDFVPEAKAVRQHNQPSCAGYAAGQGVQHDNCSLHQRCCDRSEHRQDADRCRFSVKDLQDLSSCSLLHLSADYKDETCLIEIEKQPIKEYNGSEKTDRWWQDEFYLSERSK